MYTYINIYMCIYWRVTPTLNLDSHFMAKKRCVCGPGRVFFLSRKEFCCVPEGFVFGPGGVFFCPKRGFGRHPKSQVLATFEIACFKT